MGVDDGVGLARNRRTIGIANRDDLGMLFTGVPNGHEGVGGLAGLGDRHDQGRRVDDRVAVAELAGQIDLAGHSGPVLDGVLGDHPGVVGRSTGHHDDLGDASQILRGDANLVEDQFSTVRPAAQQGVGDRTRLLEDLLAHEPVVALLLGRRQVPVDVVRASLAGVSVEVGDGDVLGRQHDDLVLTQLEGLAGVLDESGDVRGEEVLPLPQANDQRGVATSGHDGVRGVGADGHEGESALETRGHRPHGLGQRGTLLHLQSKHVSGRLAVRLRGEGDSMSLKLSAQGGEILDDSIVDDRDPAVEGQVGVGILVGRGTVGRPAGVADALVRLRERMSSELLLKIGQLARFLGPVQASTRHNRQSG